MFNLILVTLFYLGGIWLLFHPLETSPFSPYFLPVSVRTPPSHFRPNFTAAGYKLQSERNFFVRLILSSHQELLWNFFLQIPLFANKRTNKNPKT